MSTGEELQDDFAQLFELLINGYLDDVIGESAADESGAAILDVVERIGKERAKQLAKDIAKHTVNLVQAGQQSGLMRTLALGASVKGKARRR
jgi:predicted Rossmann-fold nucleotide-binding protein